MKVSAAFDELAKSALWSEASPRYERKPLLVSHEGIEGKQRLFN